MIKLRVVLATADLVVFVKSPKRYDSIPYQRLLLAGLEYDLSPEIGFGAAGEAWYGTDLEAVKESFLLESSFEWLGQGGR